MTKKINIRLEDDMKIKNILVHYGIIENPRVILCGRWFNKYNNSTKFKRIIPQRHFCMRWECRMCRRVLVEKLNNKHKVHNKTFYNQGGKLLLITLKIPHGFNDISNEFYKYFKRSITHFKESRGWEKIKNIAEGNFHYDNITVLYINEQYHIYNDVVYGLFNKIISKNTIENILTDYWKKSLSVMGFQKTIRNTLCTSWIQKINKNDINDKTSLSNIFFMKDIDLNSEIDGTLENFEINFSKLINQTKTNLKSIEYLKEKQLQQFGNVIKNINTMLKKSKRGRIWLYK